MASKSKRRGRVFRASCILAALIIAGSSFAWFTSKDEVTNRLSANADYDVRIVESFAPPKNWLPGAEVDKDVYAVNTGSIGAFVEEQITSKITITQDEKVEGNDANFAAKKDNLVKLTPAERYSVEAGSFLALKPANSTNVVGNQVVSFVEDPNSPQGLEDYVADTVLTDFKPTGASVADATGLYVFRRVIKEIDTNTRAEKFEYAGYYYDGTADEYYKVDIVTVTHDNVADIADDGVFSDGNLTGATYNFFERTTSVKVPTLKYEDRGANGKYLVATVPGSKPTTDSDLTTLAAAYDTALHNYELALAQQSAANDENDDATADEKTALDNYIAAQAAQATAQREYDEALANLNSIKNQLKAAVAERGKDDTVTGVQKDRKTSLEALYGEYTTEPDPTTFTDANGDPVNTKTRGTDYKADSLFDKMKIAYDAADTADNTTTKQDFLADLVAYASVLNAATPGTIDFGSIDTNDVNNLQDVIDLFSYAQLSAYTVTAANDNHNDYSKLAAYYLAKRDYEDELANFNALDARNTELATRIGDESNGLIKQFKEALNNTYNSALSTYTDPTYTAAVALNPNVATTDVDENTVDGDIAGTGKYAKLLQAIKNTAVKKDTYDTEHAKVDNNGAGTSANLTAANAAVAQAQAQLDAARQAYEAAVTQFDEAGDIIINIKLVKDNVTTTGGTADQWQLLPTALEDKAGGDGKADTATFYYTSILGGGKTSSQLVDSVELDPSVTQDMYKSFNFDLDVKLKSAQMVYGDDNKTILTSAVAGDANGNGALDADATLVEPQNEATAITWTARP